MRSSCVAKRLVRNLIEDWRSISFLRATFSALLTLKKFKDVLSHLLSGHIHVLINLDES